MLAVSLDDDCIRRRWLEDVPVVEQDSLDTCALPQRKRRTRRTNPRQREKDLFRLPEGLQHADDK